MLCFVCVNNCPRGEHTHSRGSSQSWEPGSWVVAATCCCPNSEKPAVPSGCVGPLPNVQGGGDCMWSPSVVQFVFLLNTL